jgi:hypothetical protein
VGMDLIGSGPKWEGTGAPSSQRCEARSRLQAHPCHICAGTWDYPCHICTGTGLAHTAGSRAVYVSHGIDRHHHYFTLLDMFLLAQAHRVVTTM